VLLDHGKAVTIGPTDSVVQTYLSDHKVLSDRHSGPVYISQAKVRGRGGDRCQFESGETAWVDIEVTARQPMDKLAVVIELRDESQSELFNTSTEQLSHRAFSLQPGESYRCTFELSLNVPHGTFHVCVVVYRYDLQKSYDSWVSTLFIGSTLTVRGVVNCFPKLIEFDAAGAVFPSRVGGGF
jgi:Wzt C-terminal domain